MSAKANPKGDWSDRDIEVTARTQAATKLADAAEAMGISEKLVLVLSHRCGNIGGVAAKSPRRQERRKDKWRGEEERKKDTALEDHTNTGGNGGLKLSELPAKQRWNIFLQNERLEREKQSSKKKCQEE